MHVRVRNQLPEAPDPRYGLNNGRLDESPGEERGSPLRPGSAWQAEPRVIDSGQGTYGGSAVSSVPVKPYAFKEGPSGVLHDPSFGGWDAELVEDAACQVLADKEV